MNRNDELASSPPQLTLDEIADALTLWIWRHHKERTLTGDQLRAMLGEKLKAARLIGFMEGVDCDELPAPPIV